MLENQREIIHRYAVYGIMQKQMGIINAMDVNVWPLLLTLVIILLTSTYIENYIASRFKPTQISSPSIVDATRSFVQMGLYMLEQIQILCSIAIAAMLSQLFNQYVDIHDNSAIVVTATAILLPVIVRTIFFMRIN